MLELLRIVKNWLVLYPNTNLNIIVVVTMVKHPTLIHHVRKVIGIVDVFTKVELSLKTSVLVNLNWEVHSNIVEGNHTSVYEVAVSSVRNPIGTSEDLVNSEKR